MAKLLENPMRLSRTILLAALALGVAIPVCAQSNAPASTPAESVPKESGTSQEPKQPAADQEADQKAERAAPASPEEARQAQIEEDTKKLFRLSAELRAEVAKTYKESLSLTVLKKAEEIEKLAKSLKTLMDRDASAAKREDH